MSAFYRQNVNLPLVTSKTLHVPAIFILFLGQIYKDNSARLDVTVRAYYFILATSLVPL